MNLAFQKRYKSAGKLKQQLKYKSFIPSLVNRDFDWDDKRIDVLHGDAMRFLGELNVYSLVPDVVYIKMNVTHGATRSNVIEGTKL